MGSGLTSHRLKDVPESAGLYYADGRVMIMSSNHQGKDGDPKQASLMMSLKQWIRLSVPWTSCTRTQSASHSQARAIGKEAGLCLSGFHTTDHKDRQLNR